MIKVLIVDDDKLVRKGLMSAMPWGEFDMEVVGEAANGERALEFLLRTPVDLLVTDLAMPVMSGIDLMRHVRKLYPDMHIVVLTLHQDFAYLQEAIRLGALDYIAKVQLEKERFEEVLARIHIRICEQEQQRGRGRRADHPMPEVLQVKHAYALLSLAQGSSGSEVRQWMDGLAGAWQELGHHLFIYLPDNHEEAEKVKLAVLRQEVEASVGWTLLKLTGINGVASDKLYDWLREYKEHAFFYEYQSTVRYREQQMPQVMENHPAVQAGQPVQSVQSVQSLQPVQSVQPPDFTQRHFHSFNWIYQDAVFEEDITQLKLLRLPQPKLLGFLYLLVDRWNLLFRHIAPLPIPLADTFESWEQVERWFHQIRAQIHNMVGKTAYAPDVMQCIMRAVHLIHEEPERPITATETAKRVNMSRSYFSQCFKEIIGESFNPYLRSVRIEKAKHYLLCTRHTIQQIALKVGYEDDKYFSRSFRQQTGVLPSEYRAQGGKGSEMSGEQVEQ
jgi:two-component system response regulator YesN